ncbi:pentapeptide repeat-containing protein [Alteromonadaceae bacterium BrNp21-10]|nr:pentapeptide repeat-containing protein [Alteromonadaceae bacterium BrNp21-10]
MSVHLHDSDFYGQQFTQLVATDSEFENKSFDGCHFTDCDFSGSVFRDCEFSDCQFVKCNMSMINVINSTFVDVGFEHCKLLGVDWSQAYWQGLSLGTPLEFNHCLLSSCSFFGLELPKLMLQHCRAHDVDFREAKLPKADFAFSDLAGALFHHTDLSEANFNDACNYHLNIHHNQVNKAIFKRLEATRLLESLDIVLVD